MTLGYALSRLISLWLSGFKLFAPPVRGTFQLSVTLLVHYRSRVIFRVGCLWHPIHARYPTHTTLASSTTTVLPLRDYHPLWCDVPVNFGFDGRSILRSILHTSLHLHAGIRFALCRFLSPVLTASQLVSFPPPTKMLQFGGFPFLKRNE